MTDLPTREGEEPSAPVPPLTRKNAARLQPVTREIICQYLGGHPLSSARDISVSLHLSVTDVRYHLEYLESKQEVVVSVSSRTGKPGRPMRQYRLPDEDNPTALHLLANALLKMYPLSKEDSLRLAEQILPPVICQSASPVIRITRAVQFFSTLGADAKWEARPSTPLVEFRHCPFNALVSHQPNCCQVDVSLLERAIGCPVSHEKTSRGTCIFRIHLDSKPENDSPSLFTSS